ncbi:MAG: ABC transporter permease [Candidatus Bipolaricaulota bacterium]|nr:ABC transporter permease [Candidatus Bipolaricaulota bacterium]
MKGLWARFREIRRYPSAIVGLSLIAVLAVVSIYTVIKIPYPEAVRLWRGTGDVWGDNPRNAWPVWINLLPGINRPTTIVRQSGPSGTKRVFPNGDVDITFQFDYPYDGFPKELNIFFTAAYTKLVPYVTVTWVYPDGREVLLRQGGVKTEQYTVAADKALQARLGGLSPEIGLFAQPGSKDRPQSQKGKYQLHINGILFEPESDLDAKLVIYGQVHGLAGTDSQRRDLTLALLWGTPIALVFGLVAAVGISMSQFLFGAVSAYYGGKTDTTVQFITRVKMVLPTLPIYMMIAMFYSRSVWVILGAVIILNLIGGGVLTYRSMFLQAKESPYIDAARAYGASNRRIVLRYLVPRVLPVLIPGFVTAIPAYVFLEASLAFLGLGDPSLPTWGKMLNESGIAALLQGHYYWVVQPAILLMITGFSFALVGFALDRIFNPRLRTL